MKDFPDAHATDVGNDLVDAVKEVLGRHGLEMNGKLEGAFRLAGKPETDSERTWFICTATEGPK